MLLVELGFVEEGIELLQEALEVRRSNIFYNNLGVGFTLLQKYKEASDAFQYHSPTHPYLSPPPHHITPHHTTPHHTTPT